MMRYSANVLDRWQDGPDALPIGTPTVVNHEPHHLKLGSSHAEELFRVRNKPELYGEWHVELVNTQREQYINTLDGDVYDWDCEHCQRAVLTLEMPAPCPFCGAPA